MVLKRLDEYLQSKRISYYQLEKRLKVSRGSISRAVKGGTNIGSNVIEKLVENYPDINTEWLLRGKGEMILPQGKILQEPEASYTLDEDKWLINKALELFGYSKKGQLIEFFERINEKEPNEISAALDTQKRLERLEMLLAKTILEFGEMKETVEKQRKD